MLLSSGLNQNEPPEVLSLEVPRVFETLASWYGGNDGFKGKRMANGERFDPNDSTTAAHHYLPFGTEVIVQNMATGKAIKVIIKDRGTCKPDRGIDLSEAAAKKLGTKTIGVAKVIATIIPSNHK